ncbi:hypothetical protein [Streptomyces sp. NPDC006879]|uniref:tetratricopeptide repeat protein n=1 Tax=Streptomyces sp. NPDC006879 TaxID=3364767 RepID=UPI0036B95D85
MAMRGAERRGEGRRPRLIAPPRVPPGPLRDFKRHVYHLYLAAGAPALEDIVKLVTEDDTLPGCPSKDTVSRLISGGTLPGLPDAETVAEVLARAQPGPVDPTEAVARTRKLWIEVNSNPTARPHTAEQWGAARLGVLPAVGGEDAEDTLTPYLVRAHDQVLRQRIRQSVADRVSVLALLVGQPSSGKTRAAYEAVCAELGDWPVLIPSGPRELLDWIGTDSVDACTVVWLDEAERFLTGPLGEETALALGTLLERISPCAVLGSMWPEYARRLASRASVAPEAPFHGRALLKRSRAEIHVPDYLSADLRVARRLAAQDPRIAAALRAALVASEDRPRLIQQLTGGPELVQLYGRGPGNAFSEIEHALLSAAVDVRRLGHSGVLPSALLAEAAVGYLPATARVTHDKAWFANAVESLVQQGALVPGRLAAGLGEPDGYHVCDYLDQSVRRSRAHLAPPPELWGAVVRHAPGAEDLCALGEAAQDRRRYGHAVRLYRRAIAMGSENARSGLALLLEEVGDGSGADTAAGTSARAWLTVAVARENAGDPQAAVRAYELAAELGGAGAWAALVRLVYAQGGAGGTEVAARAARAGDAGAWIALARLHEQSGATEPARQAYRAAAAEGEPWGWMGLARLCERAADLLGAAIAYGTAAEAGVSSAWRELVRLHWDAGRRGDAEEAALTAGAAGAEAWLDLARRRSACGDLRGAESAYLAAESVCVGSAATKLVALREAAEDPRGAEEAAASAARSGDGQAWGLLARLRERGGDPVAADRAAEEAAAVGDLEAWVVLTRMREAAADRPAAERAALKAAQAGEPSAWSALSRMRERSGDREASERAAHRAAELGEVGVWTALGRVRAETGDPESAERAFELAVGAGDPEAWGPMGGLRAARGDHAGAEEAYRSGVDAGDTEAWEGLLRTVGRRRRKSGEVWFGLADDGGLVSRLADEEWEGG